MAALASAQTVGLPGSAEDSVTARELAERAVALREGLRDVPAMLTRGWVALQAGDRQTAASDAAHAGSAAGPRRDNPGLAEALMLGALASNNPGANAALLGEAIDIWQEAGCVVDEAVARVVASRVGAPVADLGWRSRPPDSARDGRRPHRARRRAAGRGAARHPIDTHGRGAPDATARLATAEASYSGDFLEDDPYQEWAQPLAEEVRATHVALLRALAQRLREAGDVDGVVRYSLRLLVHDPFDEQAHLDLVAVQLEAGRLGEARRRYRIYTQRMKEIRVLPQPMPRVRRGPIDASDGRPVQST